MSKNIEFLQLVVEGFRSYQKATPFPLTGKGLVLIKGSNGAGKTTIFSALTWALYKINLNGTTDEKVQTWEKYRLPEWRGTRVTVTFIVNGVYYMVARHLNFKGTTKGIKAGNTLMIFRRTEDANFDQSDLVSEVQHKADQQEYINRLLGIEPRTFLNSILFGQRMARLVSSDNDEKRKLFDTLFTLDFIELTKKKAQYKKLELDQKISQLDEELKGKEALYKNLRENLSEQRNIIASFNTQKAVRIAVVEDKIHGLETSLDKFKKDLKALKTKAKGTHGADELDKLRAKYEDAMMAVDAGENLLNKAKKQARAIMAAIDEDSQSLDSANRKWYKYEQELSCVADNCPSCKQPLKKLEVEGVRKSIKALMEEQSRTIGELNNSISARKKGYLVENEKVEQIEAELSELRTIAQDAGRKYSEKKSLAKELENIKNNIASKETLIDSFDKQIETAYKELEVEKAAEPPRIDTKATESKIAFLEAEIKENKLTGTDYLVEHERVNWWITKAFSSGGLKAHVFSAMLGQLNEHIDRYAQRMGLRCRFSIDLSKPSKPFITKCYINDFEVDYSDLSGGQKQKLDCVVAFAMHDLVNTISNINFLILDEIFEGLDPNNIESIFDLIRVKSDTGKLVFVVTHSQLIDSLGSKSIYVDVDADSMVSSIS